MSVAIVKMMVYAVEMPDDASPPNLLSVKNAGVWQLPEVYCKHEGAWVQPTQCWLHTDGDWEEITLYPEEV